jgi:hypothetical protein
MIRVLYVLSHTVTLKKSHFSKFSKYLTKRKSKNRKITKSQKMTIEHLVKLKTSFKQSSLITSKTTSSMSQQSTMVKLSIRLFKMTTYK